MYYYSTGRGPRSNRRTPARVLPRAEPSHHQRAPHDAYYDDDEGPRVIELRPEQRAAAKQAMARRRARHAAKNLAKVEETEREEVWRPSALALPPWPPSLTLALTLALFLRAPTSQPAGARS